MNIIRTLDPELASINLFYKKDFYKKASNYLSIMSKYSKELDYSIAYNSTKVNSNPIAAQADFFVNLQKNFKQLDPQFQSYWTDQFNRATDEVKNQVRLKVGNSSFFRPLSDSIGTICKIENFLDDHSQYVADVGSNQIMTPLRYGGSTVNKLSPSTLQLIGELSKKTNTVFRKNLVPVTNGLATPKDAHGYNLVPDVYSFQQTQDIVTSLHQKIQTQFGDVYNLIVYYSNYNTRSPSNNIQMAANANITVDVEGYPMNTDLLLNKLKEVKDNLTTKKVLGV